MQFSSVRRVKQPDFEPISLAEAKDHLRIMQAVTDDDTYIMGLISAARVAFEARTAQTTTKTQWRAKVGGYDPCSCMGYEIPYPPLCEMPDGESPVQVWWTSDDGQKEYADPEDLVIDWDAYPMTVKYGGIDLGECGSMATIQWWAGVNAPAEIPQIWKSAMLFIIGHWYENRAAVSTDGGAMEIPMQFEMAMAACSFDGRS
jgi:uncharacterized phiE125 gp8 family phage protein